jgi:hypothetical protein
LCEGVILQSLAERLRWACGEVTRPTLPFLTHVVIIISVLALLGWPLGFAAALTAEWLGYGFDKEKQTGQLLQGMSAYVVILIAPMAETFLLAVVVTSFRKLSLSALQASIAAGLLFGVFHAWSNGPITFFAPGWLFFVCALAYQAWRSRSFPHAYWAATIPHVLNNFFASFLRL